MWCRAVCAVVALLICFSGSSSGSVVGALDWRPWARAHLAHGACADGFLKCPPSSPCHGVCVPLVSWCAVAVYKNPYAPDEIRVADLLQRLSPQQKVNLMQTAPVENNAVPELGIAQYTATECLHGYCARAPSTLFPQSTTLAASFNTRLIHRVAYAIGLEGRAWRNDWETTKNASIVPPPLTCFSPQINIVRDPR